MPAENLAPTVNVLMSRPFRIESWWPAVLRDFDLSAESLARRAGLPANLFASALRPMVDLEAWASLWQALDDEVGAPDLALRLGRMLTLDMFDPAVFAAFCSKHLHQAATRLQLYKRLVGPCRLSLEESQGLALSCHIAGMPCPPELWGSGELVACVGLVRHATRHHVVPRRVTMPVDPKDPVGLASYFGVPVARGPKYELLFDPEDAFRAFLTTDTSMWSFFEPVLRRRLAELDDDMQMTERVTTALFELLPRGRTQIGDVAGALGMSSRTVQRRLAQEHTTYGDILDHTRARFAQHYLAHTQLTITEVAFLLGYDDPNSFYPVFRNWTGMTPQAARAAARPAE